MLNLLLARHGQSEWNALGRWQGQANPPLSELGRAQAHGAAQNSGSFDAIISSDLERALHTATIISTSIGVGPVLVEPRLKERNAGEFQGLTRKEIDTQFPGMLGSGNWPPGWEDDQSLLARVRSALEEMREQIGEAGDALVVTHGGVIYAIEQQLGAHYERIANLGGRWVHLDGDRWKLGERVLMAPVELTVESGDIL